MGISLEKEVRNQLARTTLAARGVAETAAEAALENLAVHESKPRGHMSGDQRALRNRLRARGSSVGDLRDERTRTQEIPRLTDLVAYENWHRLLFTRFLTENNLLTTDAANGSVPVTLAECDELAPEFGAKDGLDLACRFASEILPGVFRKDDPALEVPLAINDRVELERLLNSIPRDVFTSTDGLGWTYQYWQAEKKDAVNASGNKIGADELPAVTQLFTEDYMVEFLYHNTIGAWHAGKVIAANPNLAETAQSEDELRQAVRLKSLGGYDFEYLRFVREPQDGDEEDNPTGPWHPASGVFEGWPKAAKELKVLDPCCGSGHFLVEGLELLIRLRMDEEGTNLENAIRCVLSDNLHGLEIDPRCTQIAAFNVALTAWKLTREPIELPPLHIACSGLGVDSSKSEWTKLAGDDKNLKYGMEQLYDLFKQAPELGSLIDPNLTDHPLFDTNFTKLQPLLEQALSRESTSYGDNERAVTAQGMAKAADLLGCTYTLVTTNVPYLGSEAFGEVLRNFSENKYQDSKQELATIFIERILAITDTDGSASIVTPFNWTFLSTYSNFREKLLNTSEIASLTFLGGGSDAFTAGPGNVVSVCLLTLSNKLPIPLSGFVSLDVSPPDKPTSKSLALKKYENRWRPQHEQLRNPDSRITLESLGFGRLLSEYSSTTSGIKTGDMDRFSRMVWEIEFPSRDWEYLQRTSGSDNPHSGRTGIIFWQKESGELAELADNLKHLNHTVQNWRSGQPVWGSKGIAVSAVGNIRCSIYQGDRYDSGVVAIVPFDQDHLAPLWSYLSSPKYEKNLRRIDSKIAITTATLAKVPFDLEHWQSVTEEKYPDGIPEPYSEDPTQWLFHGHPAKTEKKAVLQVAVARLLGYGWPAEQDSEMRLSDAAREWIERAEVLNRFADGDGIVCLPAVNRQQPAAPRLRELLGEAFGAAWNSASERDLIAATGSKKTTLENWLADDFFDQHTKLFHNRPFIWNIWDGRKDGFSALVNYHKLDYSVLQSLTYTYLGDWITKQEADVAIGKPGAAERLVAARALQSELAKILDGQAPFDIFVRWKPINEQPTGWHPDPNDGVRLNIRPFMSTQDVGKKGAGILRGKPNIKWGKDRGKEPESLRPKSEYPWFWHEDEPGSDPVGEEFSGNRWNDVHFTLAYKQRVSASI
jgi:hypothetical protein